LSKRPNKEEIEALRQKKILQQEILRQMQKDQGLTPKPHGTTPNIVSSFATVEDEREGRIEASTEQMRIIRSQLPQLLRRLNKMKDPRNPKKLKHTLASLMLYGLLMFVFQRTSRREVNREMTRPQFKENLLMLFPELVDLPHADTLFRLLCKVDVNQIELALTDMIKRLIDKKKFKRYLINNCYPIAIDGTQKMPFNALWCEQLLQRKIKTSDNQAADDDGNEYQYYIYVLEANLSFRNGMVIPLLSEFLEYTHGDMENNKQDCELKAFSRLTERLKENFPRLRIMLLLDGLYANGPIMEQCFNYKWQFMIVLKSNSLSSVWEEFESLLKRSPKNNYQMKWGERRQDFRWVNNLEYYFGPNDCNKIAINMVTCHEEWDKLDKEHDIVTTSSDHAWISSRPLNEGNVHQRCNLGARYRWGIEVCFLVEKHQGYQYEHCFGLDWQAMTGYHYLMRLGHAFNTLARYSRALAKSFREVGVRGFIDFVYSTLTGRWLDAEDVEARLNRPFQLRLE